MKKQKVALFIFLMVLLWIPFIQQLFHPFPEVKLNGAYNVPGKPVFSVDSLKTLAFQKQTEDYLNFKFGLRGGFVKIKNSLEYLFWKEIAVEDNVEGKDGYIFSKGSILRSIGADYSGYEKINATVDRIRFLKEGVEKHGGHLLVLMAPSKEYVMPDHIPYMYNSMFEKRTNYMDFIAAYKKQNIPFIDFCSYFREINDTSRFPLFTKTGFHWSMYGASVAHDSLIRYIAGLYKQPIPAYRSEGVEISDTSRFSDNDFEEPMNLLFKLDHSLYVYPKLKMIESTRKNFRPKVIVIGDSFFWQLKDQKMMMNIFSEDSKFWFYFATNSFPLGDVAGVPLKDIDVMKELESADLVLLTGSIGTLGTFPFGITDYYYDHIASEDAVASVKEYISTRPQWMQQLGKAAQLQKKRQDDVITTEAKKILRDKIAFRLKASNGKYVCADAGRGDIVVADKTDASTWELFSAFRLDENHIIITSFQDKFFSAELSSKGEVTANRKKAEGWEIFTRIDLGNGLVALKASNGNYLSLDGNTLQLVASAASIGKKEQFLWIEQ